MHFYYLDEAGCTGTDLANAEQPVFVIGGASVRDEGWNETQREFDRIMQKYFGGHVPEDFELHAGQLLSPSGDGPFEGHDRDRRNGLVRKLLGVLNARSHDVHLYAIEKKKLQAASVSGLPDGLSNVPYPLAYDYMVTYINWVIKERLGRSARGMLIIDEKQEFMRAVERITHTRRFKGPVSHRVKWIVEFSYPVDSRKNPMIQLSDLVVFCVKKFLEVDLGYRDDYQVDAKKFYAQCYAIIHDRIAKKGLVKRNGRGMDVLNQLLSDVRATPSGQWKGRYGV